MKKSDQQSAEAALIGALSADPQVSAEVARLRAATEKYAAIRETLYDETIERNAVRREATARQELVRSRALTEIGQAAQADVDAARSEHMAAKEELDSLAGRYEVLTGELRKAQTEVREAQSVYNERMSPWLLQVKDAAKRAAEDGIRLIQTAAAAMRQVGRDYGPLPDNPQNLVEWLFANRPEISRTLVEFPVAAEVSAALAVERRAGYLAIEEIRAPSPPSQEVYAPDARRPTPSFDAPGMPAGLTHDALGNPLPGARSDLAARPQLVSSAPSDDPRGDAEEVA